MRHFQLVNEIGGTFDLSANKNPFLFSPKGLGVNFIATYGNPVDGFFGSTVYKGAQPSVAGTLVFTDDPYKRFREFIAFVESSKELKFGYKPKSAWYYASCTLSRCEKTELTRAGLLECAVEFKLLSPWAKENPIRKKITPSASQLVYPMVYPFTYGGSVSGSVEFTITGDMDGSYEISIPGALSNPVIKLEVFNGDYSVIGKAELSCNIASGETLEFSTRPDNSYIRKTNGSTETDLTAFVNIENDVFRRPPQGRCRISVESDTQTPINADVTVYDYFRAV